MRICRGSCAMPGVAIWPNSGRQIDGPDTRLSHHPVVAEARANTQSTARPRSDQLADRCSCRHALACRGERGDRAAFPCRASAIRSGLNPVGFDQHLNCWPTLEDVRPHENPNTGIPSTVKPLLTPERLSVEAWNC